ncbi:hypothetical protein [Streptomyces sp. NPDC046197]|uniref:hypothetical protein n=1 Tax=Streptomyces sp. NPDC046197 TaxID=3154337 RepID=UPI0033F5272D
MALSRTSRTARKLAAVVGAVGVLGTASCSAGGSSVSPGELRKYAGSEQAVQARQHAETHLRGIVQAYDKDTPLTLALVTVRDYCKTSSSGDWLSGDDTYKVRCDVAVTAYYGADPDRIGDVLDGVLAAGDRYKAAPTPRGGVALGHDDHRRKLVAYYRGHGPNPQGPDTQEPSQISDTSQTLNWDMVRTHQHRTLVGEPPVCVKPDPPVTRCDHEDQSTTVTDIRKKYGMVFELSLPTLEYYEVFKDGQTHTTW